MSTLIALRPRPCLADSNRTPRAINELTIARWELHIGTVQLFIVGPGENAWRAASLPQYDPAEKVGTPEERAIAQRAILILDRQHRYNLAAGPEEIQAALEAARRGETPESAQPRTERGIYPRRELASKAQRPPVDMPEFLRIVGIVSRLTGIKESTLLSGYRTTPAATRARFQCIAAARAAFPQTQQRAIGEALTREWSSISYALIRHTELLERDTKYRAAFAAITAAIASGTSSSTSH